MTCEEIHLQQQLQLWKRSYENVDHLMQQWKAEHQDEVNNHLEKKARLCAALEEIACLEQRFIQLESKLGSLEHSREDFDAAESLLLLSSNPREAALLKQTDIGTTSYLFTKPFHRIQRTEMESNEQHRSAQK